MIIKPPRLKPGDGIGVIAPAGPVSPNELQSGIDLLISMGYDVHISEHLYNQKDYLAGHDDARLEDLHVMFGDKSIKAVFCARGGYGTLRLLNQIDYDLIRENPKIIVGYSDITALLLSIYHKVGLVTFHGPMVRELSHDKDPEPIFHPFISQEPYSLDLSNGRTLIKQRAQGILLGGNLTLISHLIGTPFMSSLDHAILFIEERGEPLYRIDRMLTHLKLSGILDNLSGLIIGHFENCGDLSAIDQLIMDMGIALGIPVCSGLPIGHGLENMTLPMGLAAHLDTIDMKLTILESAVGD